MTYSSIRIIFFLLLFFISFPLAAKLYKIEHVIHFSKNNPKIREPSLPILKDVAEIIKANRDEIYRVTITGYTDAVGSEAKNLRISLLQAEAVKKELIKLGLPFYMLRVEAYGEVLPIDTNETEEGRARNRRVEFSVVMPECWSRSAAYSQDPAFLADAIASEEKNIAELNQADITTVSQREFNLNCLIHLNLQIKDYQKVRLYFDEMFEWNIRHLNDAPYLLWSGNVDPLTELIVPHEGWEKVPVFIAMTTNRYPENSFERAEYLLKLADLYSQQKLSHPVLWLSLNAKSIVKKQFESPALIAQRLSVRSKADLKYVEKELDVIIKTALYLIHEGYEEWARDLVNAQDNFAHKLHLPSNDDRKRIKQNEQITAWFLQAELEAAYGSHKKSKKLYMKALKWLDDQVELDDFEKKLKEKIEVALAKIS